jgi:hypothetical protein
MGFHQSGSISHDLPFMVPNLRLRSPGTISLRQTHGYRKAHRHLIFIGLPISARQ